MWVSKIKPLEDLKMVLFQIIIGQTQRNEQENIDTSFPEMVEHGVRIWSNYSHSQEYIESSGSLPSPSTMRQYLQQCFIITQSRNSLLHEEQINIYNLFLQQISVNWKRSSLPMPVVPWINLGNCTLSEKSQNDHLDDSLHRKCLGSRCICSQG